MNKIVMYAWFKYIDSTKKVPTFFWYKIFRALVYIRSRKNECIDIYEGYKYELQHYTRDRFTDK